MTLNGPVISIFEKLTSRASFWRIICLVLRSFQIWPQTTWNDRVTSKLAAKSTRYQSRPRYFFWLNFKGFSMIKCHFFTRPRPARVFSNFLMLTNTEKTWNFGIKLCSWATGRHQVPKYLIFLNSTGPITLLSTFFVRFRDIFFEKIFGFFLSFPKNLC